MMTPVADVPGAVAVTPLVRQLLGVPIQRRPRLRLRRCRCGRLVRGSRRPLGSPDVPDQRSGRRRPTRHVPAPPRPSDDRRRPGCRRSRRPGGDRRIVDRSRRRPRHPLGRVACRRSDGPTRPSSRFAATVPRHGPIPLGSGVASRRPALSPRRYRCGERRARTSVARRRRARPTTPDVWPGWRRSVGRVATAMPRSVMRSEPSTWRRGRATTRRWRRRTRC